MEFALGILGALAVCLFGEAVFERRRLPFPIDSLRTGRLHYLLLGILAGMLFPEDERLFPLFDRMRHSLIGIGLLWLGFQAGLDFIVGRFQRYSTRGVLSEGARVLGAFLLAVVAVMASRTVLEIHLGVRDHLGLVALLLGVFVTTHRTVEPILQRRDAPFSPGPSSPRPLPAAANPVAFLLLGVLSPLFRGHAVVQVGPIVSTGYWSGLIAAAGLALLMGIALDFVFRAHRNSLRCIYLTAGIVAIVGGICLHLQIPGIFVGFAGGAWLVNTTVRRREVLELTERAGEGVERLLFLLMGSLIGGYSGGLFFEPAALIPFAVILLLVRAASRMAGASAGGYISGQKWTWEMLWRAGWHPPGSLSSGVVIQMLYLPIPLAHNTLIAGALLSVFLNQLLPPSPPRRAAGGLAARQPNRTPSQG